ncbi:MAG: glycosyltransferase family 39 protein [Planctomycetota bacterium]|nr:glycosyltransferase family 39 protein [Planctomycetota bacterium]
MLRPAALWCLALVAVHAALYASVPAAGFMTDDFLWLESAGLDVSWYEHAASRRPFGYLRPLFHLLVSGSRACFGFDATPLHLLAISCSVAAASLLFALTRQVTRSHLAAGVAALLLTVHPAQAIAVSWISSLPSLLAITFGLLSLWFWQAWSRRGRASYAFGALFAHAMALASKEEAVVVFAAILAWSLLAPPRRGRALALTGHAALTLSFVGLWLTVGAAATPHAPRGVDWLAAAAEPLVRARALWLPRHVVTEPYAELLLLIVGLRWWRRAPRARATWCAGIMIALLSLLPSSVGLWGFPWDKLERLMSPAVSAAALVVGLWVAGLRPRVAPLCAVAVLLALFAARSHKVVGRRVADAGRVEALVAALSAVQGHLQAAVTREERVAIIGYEATWSDERAWIYPSGPARALAPGLRVVPEAGADVVLRWDAARGGFKVVRGARTSR